MPTTNDQRTRLLRLLMRNLFRNSDDIDF